MKHSNDFFVLKWSPLLPDLNLIEDLSNSIGLTAGDPQPTRSGRNM